MYDKLLTTRQKALKVNLNPEIYGSFAEIGAGQEVAANFFKAGASSGTIAKTMSAYDMTFSDAIYGHEESGRYVCESRLTKMLRHEYNLVEKRLGKKRGNTSTFFAFSNTVVALNYHKTNEAHGWIGLRFQLQPLGGYNDVVVHVRMLDNDNLQQQQAIGIIGVNLIYGCFFYHQEPESLLLSLMDDLDKDRIEIDMIRFDGVDFRHVDNRLMSLYLVKNGFTDAALFDPTGHVLQPSETLYKKNVLALRGRFRPATHVNLDMLQNGLDQFLNDPDVDFQKVVVLTELTLHDLQGNNDAIDIKDFLDRVDILCSLGQTVLISNHYEYYKLVAYLAKMARNKIGITLGMNNLEYIFNESHYHNLPGGILEAFGRLFGRNVTLYVYPMLKTNGEVYTPKDFRLSNNLQDLFEYLIVNKKVESIDNYNKDVLHIHSDTVLDMIKNGIAGWEAMVPLSVSRIIKQKKLFGFQSNSDPEKAQTIIQKGILDDLIAQRKQQLAKANEAKQSE